MLIALDCAAEPASRTLTTAIPGQPLSLAIESFAEQTGVQVIYVSELANGRISVGVPAGVSAAEALPRLLAGTDLRFEFLNARTIRLLPAAPPTPPTGKPMPTVATPRVERGEQPDSLLQEIVVTATKHEQSLQDVPVAVTVKTADVLAKAQIRDLFELQSIVPSLRVTQLQSTTQSDFLIRGFGNGANNPGVESSVGVFIDGVYRSRSASQIGDLVDVQRVEILRGPQSTLFGQNASAGVISIATLKPAFTPGGSAELSVGNHRALIAHARYTGPLTDRIAFSLTAGSNTREGYFTNLANGHQINDRDRRDFRGQLLFNATGTLSFRLIADSGRVYERCCGVVSVVNGPTAPLIQAVGGNLYSGDPFDRKAYLNRDPESNVTNRGVSLQTDWQHDSIKLISITALRYQRAIFDYDTDFTSADLLPTNLNDQSIDTFTQEFRVHFEPGGPLTGQLGGYYFNERLKVDDTIAYGAHMRTYVTGLIGAQTGSATALNDLENSLALPAGTFFHTGTGGAIDARQRNESYTLFGQADWRLARRLTLTAGMAYTQNHKRVRLAYGNSDLFGSLDLVQLGFASAFSALTGGAAATAANFAAFPAQATLADAISVHSCSASTPPPLCNPALALYPLQIGSAVVPDNNGRSDDGKATYTIRLAYDIQEHLKIYGGVSTGFKATSWILSRDSKPFPPAVPDRSPLGGFLNPYYGRYGTRFAGPENSTAYELGLKGTWPHHALYVALFNQSIRGFQSNVFNGTAFNLANAGKQSTEGAEIETVWAPNRRWEFSFSGTFLNPRYDNFINAEGPAGPTDLSGTRPAGVHTRSVSTAVTYQWHAGSFQCFLRADGQYANQVQVVENVSASVAARSVYTVDASAGVSRSGWDVLLWGHNLTDDDYLLSAFPSVAQAGSVSGYPNVPRLWGLLLRKTF